MKKSISYLRDKIKLVANNKDVFFIIILVLTTINSFGLGRLSKIDENRTPLQVKNTALIGDFDENSSIKGNYVASKNGSKYHLPWCSGAQTISEENKIWFGTKEEAEGRGYAPAKNCKGI